jgi:hypothetical protein
MADGLLVLRGAEYVQNEAKAVPSIRHGGIRAALDGGEWSASRPGHALPLSVPIG